MTNTETTAGTEFEPTDYNVTIQRTFDAPRQRVWAAMTEPEQVKQWWGPEGFTVPRCEMDVRPDGAYRVDMRAPDGTIYPTDAVFREIVEPEQFVVTSRTSEDDEGNPQPELRYTATFADRDGKTELTLEVEVITATPAMADGLEGMEPVLSQSFDSLAIHLEEEDQ